MNKQMQAGFTLIELMIVIAIIGILATVAFPFYQDYTVRAKMTEPMLAATTCKTTISEAANTGLPTEPEANKWGCGEKDSGGDLGGEEIKSQYVEALTTSETGMISVKVKGISGVDGEEIQLTPQKSDGDDLVDMTKEDFKAGKNKAIAGWKCSFTGAKKYVPTSCRQSS